MVVLSFLSLSDIKAFFKRPLHAYLTLRIHCSSGPQFRCPETQRSLYVRLPQSVFISSHPEAVILFVLVQNSEWCQGVHGSTLRLPIQHFREERWCKGLAWNGLRNFPDPVLKLSCVVCFFFSEVTRKKAHNMLEVSRFYFFYDIDKLKQWFSTRLLWDPFKGATQY